MRKTISSLSKVLIAVPMAVVLSSNADAQPSFKTPVSYRDAGARADVILSRMSNAEKLQLISGHNSFFIKGFPEHGVPELYLADATMGVNIRRNLSNALERSVAFPAAIGLAASWNPGLAYDYALSVGEECRAGGVAVLLGPGLNMYRNSQCGRNFEYFGEDPHLVAQIIRRYVTGVLDTGTIPTLKHFAANSTDHHRRTSNSIVDERTLREIYLPGFQAGVDAGAMAVMTAYNQLNGEWCGQSEEVINGLLRRDLGFKWLVMSDWWSVWDAEKIVRSGLDLEMPGEKYIARDGARFLEQGKITEAQIDRMAKSILRTTIAMGLHDRPVKDEYFLRNYPEHEKVALRAGREAVVLLKNTGGILPIKKDDTRRILLAGKFVEELPAGGGAATVEGYDVVLLGEALKHTYGDRIEHVKEPTDEQLKAADVVLLSTGTRDSEGWDRPFALPEADEKAVRRVVALNPRTIVVVHSGSGIRMTDWSDAAAAIVYAWYPGQSGNTALAEILCGDVNPSGKLPITIERRFEDSPAYGYLPEGEELYVGWGPDNDMSHPIIDVEYKEGVFMGYRWYEAKKIEPLFAFGHGLSYTTFEYSDLNVTPPQLPAVGRVSVTFKVTNTGKVAGAETTQLYVSPIAEQPVPRPVKELKGFSKVWLEPGESTTVRVRLSQQDFSYWDVKSDGWKAEPGDYAILVGGASDQIVLRDTVTLK